MRENSEQRDGNMRTSGNWQFDRRISLPGMVGVVINVAAMVWFAATLTADVTETRRIADANTQRISEMAQDERTTILGTGGMSERLTRIEVQQTSNQKSLDRIENLLSLTQASGNDKTHK